MTSASPRMRFGAIAIVMVSLFAALFARLWFLQVMTAPEYQLAAENNRVRVVQIEAPRGRILDRDGQELVTNRRSIVVTVDWQRYNRMEPPRQSDLLTRLAQILTEDAAQRATGALRSGDPGGVAPSTTTTPGGGTGSSVPEGSTTSTTTSTTTTTTVPAGTVDTGEERPTAVTVDQLEKRLADQRFSHFKPVPVATEVSEDLEIYLTEHADEYPGVAVERITIRNYEYGQLLAHVLGYVGAINEDELEAYQNDEKPYEQDDEIGKAGIERLMEEQLRGTPGEIRYEVDARNVPVRRLEGGRAPVPGNDVYLSVDIDLQYLVEKSLAAQLKVVSNGAQCDRDGCDELGGFEGSVVVQDPRDGTLLALASYPTYDPSDFIGGISTQAYAALTSKGNHEPFLNKAIAGQYAPGSTWKLFSAAAGLEQGQITPGTAVHDPGYYDVPDCETATGARCTFNGFQRKALGTVNLTSAMTQSSDVYFYKLGDDMWRRRDQLGDDALARTYREWGFGESSGLGLTGEADGRVPDPKWLRTFAEQLYEGDEAAIEDHGTWRAGTSLNTAIGQGDVLVTPLQLANGYSTFANGGTLFTPQLVLQVARYESSQVVWVAEPKPVRDVPMQPDWRASLLDGLKGVTISGTAAATFDGFPMDRLAVAGKTGTAQVNDKADTSLFAAFAPADAPTLTIAAILPEAGTGGSAAAPLVRRILEPLAVFGGDLRAIDGTTPAGGGFDVDQAVNEVPVQSSEGGD